MGGIIKHVRPGMAADTLQEHFIGNPVVKVLTGVDFITDIDTAFLGMIEYRLPALRQFIERCFNQARRALWPGIDIGPGQCAGERCMGVDVHIARR